ncbi:MAG: ribonuclease PH [Holosporales bacterium]|jgi:ribonuclease PH|nr:ribonuclease PH [Holosporales bacterium]
MKRSNGRKEDELRQLFLGPGFVKNALGSCFVKFGDTHVVCTATLDEKVPPFLRNTGSGWITAEYGMLPCSSSERIEREAVKGKQSGRTQEIQRLIGRALRTAVDLRLLGERQIKIDCDVIQADGGTRTASITGGYVALAQAVQQLLRRRRLDCNPIVRQIAAISCGIVDGAALLDLDYAEDSNADVDANFVMDSDLNIVEIQMTAEKNPFSKASLDKLLAFAEKGIKEIATAQQSLNLIGAK